MYFSHIWTHVFFFQNKMPFDIDIIKITSWLICTLSKLPIPMPFILLQKYVMLKKDLMI